MRCLSIVTYFEPLDSFYQASFCNMNIGKGRHCALRSLKDLSNLTFESTLFNSITVLNDSQSVPELTWPVLLRRGKLL